MFIFNIGFILPLVVIFFLSTRKPVLEKLKQANTKLTRYGVIATSAIMILMGVAIL